jgi:hypothetical protein
VIKRIRPTTVPIAAATWRDLHDATEVELTSEDPASPVEGALLMDGGGGWRAAEPGPQTITLTWREPIAIARIRLVFEEQSHTRTQEFVVRASLPDGPHEIIRQQFTFAPPFTTVEREEYATDLDAVSRLELVIIPAIDGASVVATLREWRIA